MSKSEIRSSNCETNSTGENLRRKNLRKNAALMQVGVQFSNLFQRSKFGYRISRIWAVLLWLVTFTVTQHAGAQSAASGLASWYGEEHRGKLMANGQPFDPDKLTAASWSFPLGTKVRVMLALAGEPARSVVVTITDRGPNPQLVRQGRIIDLSYAAFKQLASPGSGIVPARVELAKADNPQRPAASPPSIQ